MSTNILLSVIIPAYQQVHTIQKDLNNIKKVLENIRYEWEIIIVIDGNIDNTFTKIKRYKSRQIKIIKFKKNHGKGYAIQAGMKKAKGDYILFLDSGMEIDPNGISMLMEHLEWYEADIILGSKRHPVSKVNYPLERKILSIGYFWLVKILFGIKVKDTQPGIKIFRKEVISKILPLLTIKKYAFDIEIIALAERLGFKRIYEAPIKLKYNFGSLTSASTFNTIIRMFWDTLKVFYRLNFTNVYNIKK
jgi:glycosyltransferase involved in cell wall biosynthesis